MERYIQKINDKLIASNDKNKAKKTKLAYQISGGVILGVGIAGFLALFIAFMVLFFKFKTEGAFTAWLYAIPFIPLIVAGSVLSRIGDALLPAKKHFKKYKYEKENAKKEKEKNSIAQSK